LYFNFSIPLTSYFLDCVPFVLNNSSSRINGDSSQNKSNGRLVKAYSKFIQLMWTKPLNGRQNHVMNPSLIAVEIRSINPSFRSYTQQVIFYLNNSNENLDFYFEGCTRISSMFYG